MVDLHDTYINFCYSNWIDTDKNQVKKSDKSFDERKYNCVALSLPKHKNESEWVYFKFKRDSVIVKLDNPVKSNLLQFLLQASWLENWFWMPCTGCLREVKMVNWAYSWSTVFSKGVWLEKGYSLVAQSVNRKDAWAKHWCLSICHKTKYHKPDSSNKQWHEFPIQFPSVYLQMLFNLFPLLCKDLCLLFSYLGH